MITGRVDVNIIQYGENDDSILFVRELTTTGTMQIRADYHYDRDGTCLSCHIDFRRERKGGHAFWENIEGGLTLVGKEGDDVDPVNIGALANEAFLRCQSHRSSGKTIPFLELPLLPLAARSPDVPQVFVDPCSHASKP